jgi:hypothetical protein
VQTMLRQAEKMKLVVKSVKVLSVQKKSSNS